MEQGFRGGEQTHVVHPACGRIVRWSGDLGKAANLRFCDDVRVGRGAPLLWTATWSFQGDTLTSADVSIADLAPVFAGEHG